MPVMVFGYLILISIDSSRFYFSVFSLVLISIEKIYQTHGTVFHRISKHLDVRQKYSSARRIFNSVVGVWKCGKTRSLAAFPSRFPRFRHATKANVYFTPIPLFETSKFFLLQQHLENYHFSLFSSCSNLASIFLPNNILFAYTLNIG